MNRRSTEDYKQSKTGRERSRSPRGDERQHEEQRMENIALGAKHRLKSIGIQMKLNQRTKGNTSASAASARPKLSVATAFNQDSDDEPEEMPPEAKMRMRNIGRDTPTSSGPNSFGKTKHGFSDAKKVFEKNLRQAMENVEPEKRKDMKDISDHVS